VLVVVIAVFRVAVTAVQIVDVVTMRHGLVTAVRPMMVLVRTSDDVHVVECALVVVAVVAVMRVAIMEVVDVIVVLHRDVTTVGTVHVRVALVGGTGGGHEPLLCVGVARRARHPRIITSIYRDVTMYRCGEWLAQGPTAPPKMATGTPPTYEVGFADVLGCRPEKNGGPMARSGGTWTFLTNHAHVLVCIAENPDMRGREIAQEVGISERAVQGIIGDLVAAGYVIRERDGRRNHYTINLDGDLRHPLEHDHTVGELLTMLGRLS
jgi:hypothetical protein